MPSSSDPRILLTEALRNHLNKGLALDPDTVAFVDATVCVDSAGDLAGVFDDPEDGEAVLIFDAIFYPDRRLQEEIEDILDAGALSPVDVNAVVDHLLDPPMRIPLIFPDHRGTHRVTPHRQVLCRMVERLHSDRTLPKPVLCACKGLPETVSRKVRVSLRNSRPIGAPKAVEFLVAYLSNADPGAADFLDALHTGLNLLETLPEEDIFAGLSRRRNELADALARADHLARETSGRNMETLMLQGVRQPHIDRDAARKTMCHIDLLCRTAFGRIGWTTAAPQAEDLGTIAGPDELDTLVRRLV